MLRLLLPIQRASHQLKKVNRQLVGELGKDRNQHLANLLGHCFVRTGYVRLPRQGQVGGLQRCTLANISAGDCCGRKSVDVHAVHADCTVGVNAADALGAIDCRCIGLGHQLIFLPFASKLGHKLNQVRAAADDLPMRAAPLGTAQDELNHLVLDGPGRDLGRKGPRLLSGRVHLPSGSEGGGRILPGARVGSVGVLLAARYPTIRGGYINLILRPGLVLVVVNVLVGAGLDRIGLR